MVADQIIQSMRAGVCCAGRMAPEHNVTGGLMAAVGLSAEAADARLRKEGLTNTVVGCDNSPVNVTLAGAARPQI